MSRCGQLCNEIYGRIMHAKDARKGETTVINGHQRRTRNATKTVAHTPLRDGVCTKYKVQKLERGDKSRRETETSSHSQLTNYHFRNSLWIVFFSALKHRHRRRRWVDSWQCWLHELYGMLNSICVWQYFRCSVTGERMMMRLAKFSHFFGTLLPDLAHSVLYILRIFSSPRRFY